MNAHIASIINAATLIALGAWGYFGSEDPSITALIPVGIGGILLVCSPGVKSENKAVAHVAVLLTLLMLFGLIMPLKGAIGREDTAAILRVIVMMASTVFAMVFFVRSFIEARRRRENAQG